MEVFRAPAVAQRCRRFSAALRLKSPISPGVDFRGGRFDGGKVEWMPEATFDAARCSLSVLPRRSAAG
jgi:hypothetical protein